MTKEKQAEQDLDNDIDIVSKDFDDENTDTFDVSDDIDSICNDAEELGLNDDQLDTVYQTADSINKDLSQDDFADASDEFDDLLDYIDMVD